MRFFRGVVKVPIKYVYLFLILTCTAFYLYSQLSNYHRRKRETVCKVTAPTKRPHGRKKTTSKAQQLHPGCSNDPFQVEFKNCPHCYRSTVYNLSKQLNMVKYSSSMFPRGPPDLFKPRNQVQQEAIRDVLLTPLAMCVNTCPYLVALLLSVASDEAQRNAIRLTWGSSVKTKLWPYAEMNADMHLIFVLAHQTETTNGHLQGTYHKGKYVDQERYPTVREWEKIKSESDMHGDILYINMQDSYFNLTLKLMSAFQWVADYCPKAKFVLKVDVDTFVNVPLLLDLLIYNEERLEYAITGKVYGDERTVRRLGRWTVDHETYPVPSYPVYVSGCAYVISLGAMEALLDNFPYFPMFHIEDAFVTGVLARLANVAHFQDEGNTFTHNMDYNWEPCEMHNETKALATGVTFPFKLTNNWAGFVHRDQTCRFKSVLAMNCYCTSDEPY